MPACLLFMWFCFSEVVGGRQKPVVESLDRAVATHPTPYLRRVRSCLPTVGCVALGGNQKVVKSISLDWTSALLDSRGHARSDATALSATQQSAVQQTDHLHTRWYQSSQTGGKQSSCVVPKLSQGLVWNAQPPSPFWESSPIGQRVGSGCLANLLLLPSLLHRPLMADQLPKQNGWKVGLALLLLERPTKSSLTRGSSFVAVPERRSDRYC